jgi:S1-C subfamily serine protease
MGIPARGSALLLCMTACSTPYTPEEKEVSFQAHREARVDGVPMADYLRARTALLLRSIRVTEATVQGTSLLIKGEAIPGAPGGLGTAVPVSADGYYLTAAHCVSGQPPDPGRFVVPEDGLAKIVMSIVVTNGHDIRRGPARLVWVSDQGDLAVLQSSAAPFEILPWETAELPPDSAVIASGYESVIGAATLGQSGGYAGPSAGLYRGRGLTTSDYSEVFHDAPLAHGDSGGPLVTGQGKLIGLNTRITGGLFGRGSSVALQPDPAKLRAVIESDRRRKER